MLFNKEAILKISLWYVSWYIGLFPSNTVVFFFFLKIHDMLFDCHTNNCIFMLHIKKNHWNMYRKQFLFIKKPDVKKNVTLKTLF